MSYKTLKEMPKFVCFERNGYTKTFFFRIPHKNGETDYIETYIGTGFSEDKDIWVEWAYYEHSDEGGELAEYFSSSSTESLSERFNEILALAYDIYKENNKIKNLMKG